jgi:hypothetical protein
MQTGEGPKRQTVNLRIAVGLHGIHTTHDQNAFAVKACETFQTGTVKGVAQPGIEKNSSPERHGTFSRNQKHATGPDLRGLTYCLQNEAEQ